MRNDSRRSALIVVFLLSSVMAAMVGGSIFFRGRPAKMGSVAMTSNSLLRAGRYVEAADAFEREGNLPGLAECRFHLRQREPMFAACAALIASGTDANRGIACRWAGMWLLRDGETARARREFERGDKYDDEVCRRYLMEMR